MEAHIQYTLNAISESRADVNQIGVDSDSTNGNYENITPKAIEDKKSKQITKTKSFTNDTGDFVTLRQMKIICFVQLMVFIVTITTFSIVIYKLVSS